jgi:DNA-binding transcriptional LysR family regulator
MLDARRMWLLAELERLGTVAAVAAEQHITAPGVSLQLGALEREVGVALTERRGRRLALTPAGHALAAHARLVHDQLALAEYEIDALRDGAVGHYRIAAFPSAARTILLDTWTTLAKERTLTVELITLEPEGAVDAVLAGTVDVAVVHSYTNVPRHLPAGMNSRPLGVEPVWLVRPLDSAAPGSGDRVELARLADRPWIVPSRTLTCFEMVDRACSIAGFRPTVVAETADFDVQLDLVRAGVGVALVPDLALGDRRSGVHVAHPDPDVHRHLLAIHRTARDNDPGIARLEGMLAAAAERRAVPRFTTAASPARASRRPPARPGRSNG